MTGENVRKLDEEFDEDAFEPDGLSVGDVLEMLEDVAESVKQIGEETQTIPFHVGGEGGRGGGGEKTQLGFGGGKKTLQHEGYHVSGRFLVRIVRHYGPE